METETYHYEILPYICLINTFRIVVISVLPEEKGCVDAVEPGVDKGHTEYGGTSGAHRPRAECHEPAQ